MLTPAERRAKINAVIRVSAGNFLEMYDFFLFGIYARQIGQTFFPSDEPYASLMATFLSFAAKNPTVPLHAVVLGKQLPERRLPQITYHLVMPIPDFRAGPPRG